MAAGFATGSRGIGFAVAAWAFVGFAACGFAGDFEVMAEPVLFAIFLETFTAAFLATGDFFATGLTVFFATAFLATTFFTTAFFVTTFLAAVFFLLAARLAGACLAGRFATVRVLFTAFLAAFLAVFFAVFFAEADFWARAVAIFSSWAGRVGTPLRA